MLIGFSLFFNNIGELFISLFKGMEMMQLSVIVNAIYTILIIGLGYTILKSNDPLFRLGLLFIAGRIVFLIVGIFIYKIIKGSMSIRIGFDLKLMWNILKDSIQKTQPNFFLLNALNQVCFALHSYLIFVVSIVPFCLPLIGSLWLNRSLTLFKFSPSTQSSSSIHGLLLDSSISCT